MLDDFTDKTFDAVVNSMLGKKTFDADEIRNGAIEFYSLEKAVEQYTTIYREILFKK